MTLARRSRSPIGAVAVALLLTGGLGVPVSGLSDDHEAASEVVLLANDGVLPLDPDLSLAVITAEPAQPADTSLADELEAGAVVDLGPALPAELGTPAPVPVELLTTADGRAGLTAELFARPDFTEPLARDRVAGVVRGMSPELDDAAAVRWTGRLTAPADGRYTLSLAATGHSSLAVDGVAAPAQVPELSTALAVGDAAVARSGPVELDLAAGQTVEIEVEQSDSGPHPRAVLGWHAPDDVASEAVAEVVDVAAAADTVIIHVPAVVDGPAEAADEEVAAEVPGLLPVDHTQLVQRVVEANPRTVVVLDAAADPSLFTWLEEVAAVVHVPSAVADSRLLADLLDGARTPSGVLTEPLLPSDLSDDPTAEGNATPEGDTGDAAPELGFPTGFGLTYETTEPTAPAPELTDGPSGEPTGQPTVEPTDGPTVEPTGEPTDGPTVEPTGGPTVEPTGEPTDGPTVEPTGGPADGLTGEPADGPTGEPTADPTVGPIGEPTNEPTAEPTLGAIGEPTHEPTAEPITEPTGDPTVPEQLRELGEPDRTAPEGDRRPRQRSQSGAIAITGRVPGHTPGLYLSVSADAAALGEAEFLEDRWQLRGALPAITVVDTRNDQQTGWTVSAQMSDLAGPSHVLPAGSVGWTPSLIDVVKGVTAGPSVATRLSGGPGLAESAVLGRAVGAAPPGRTELGADLVLETGYDTAPGRYAGSLTVTIFPTEAD